MKLMINLIKPTSGKILFDNTNILELCQKDITENIYYVNQSTT